MSDSGTQRKPGHRTILVLVVALVLALAVVAFLSLSVGSLRQVAHLGSEQYEAGERVLHSVSKADRSARGSTTIDSGIPPVRPSGLKLIYDAEMTVSVGKEMGDSFPTRLAEQAQAAGGYVSQTTSSHQVGAQPQGWIVVRVPSDRLQAVMDWVRQSATILESSMRVDDITEQYSDLEARLGNLKAGEARLKELLAKETGKLAEMLSVEREIRRVREEIDVIEGRKRLWDNRIAFSTLTVHYRSASIYRAEEPAPQTFAQRARQAMRDSWKLFVRGMADLAVGGIFALPWLPLPIIIVVLLVIRLRRARRRSTGA